ncbi:hypothetical protein BN946_scf184940.g6 [Trametes cinnabarina]|uniref:DDE-1 domain-containing protein n=1 Tax=Pycnoporus cinnabarinus TaxID=5643 RepID=A0A060SI25_PYCCI|nr:hypothetical protein BN946_scf184940.g6 [Trametes cinnabarina]
MARHTQNSVGSQTRRLGTCGMVSGPRSARTRHLPAGSKGHAARTHAKKPQSRKETLRYSEDTLAEACKTLEADPELTYAAAARQFSIPETTLRARYKGIHTSRRSSHGSQQLLTPEEEDALCDWIEHLSLEGAPVDKDTVRDMVQAVTGSETPPNRRPSGLAPERARAFNRTNVEDYFKQLRDLIEQYKIPWSHVYNMDEKGMQRGGRGKIKRIKYLVPRGRRANYKLRSSNLELITIIECVCADGSSIQPGFIFAGKEFSRDLFHDIDPRVCIALSRTGWTAEYLCLEWFKRCFIPQANAHRVSDAPILLILDGHNLHITPEMRQAAIENNIHLFLLPPHTTHHLQPLDVSIFAALEHAWQIHCNKFFKMSKGDDMDRGEFIRQYLAVRKSVFTEDLVCKAWRTSGITTGDFSADTFSEADYAPSRAFSYLAHILPSYPTHDPLFPENRHQPPAPFSPSPVNVPPSPTPSMHPESQVDNLASDSSDDADDLDDSDNSNNPSPAMADFAPARASSNNIHPSLPGPFAPPAESATQLCTSRLAINDSFTSERAHLRDRTRTLRQQRSTPALLSHLQDQVCALRDELTDLYARYWHTEAHAKLAELHIGDLQKQLNYISQKHRRKRRPLCTTAICLTTGEGLAMSQQQEAEEAAKAEQRAADQARREREEARRQEERVRVLSNPNHRFGGSLARKVKDDLRDIAFACHGPCWSGNT